ncbi:MAG: hypothetical protein WAK55_26380, partial [Xanthobacteraceae bacterium]
ISRSGLDACVGALSNGDILFATRLERSSNFLPLGTVGSLFWHVALGDIATTHLFTSGRPTSATDAKANTARPLAEN